MAKKKKQTRKKKVEAPVVERSPFWALAGAIVLMLAAIFLLLGGFGTGGHLPVNLFHATYWTFGWAAYLGPIALIYWGVYKFMAEDRRIPLSKLLGMLSVLIFASAWSYAAFASRNVGGNEGWHGGHGGAVGRTLGNVVLGALDKTPAASSACGL